MLRSISVSKLVIGLRGRTRCCFCIDAASSEEVSGGASDNVDKDRSCRVEKGLLVHVAAFIAGLFCCLGVALDAFQTIILPRRPTGRFQITRIFFIATWAPWVVMAERASNKKVREQIYSIYGPLSLLLLLLLWALLLISGFATVLFLDAVSVWRRDDGAYAPASWRSSALTCMSVARRCLLSDLAMWCLTTCLLAAFIIFESGVGLGFVALVIGYLPVLYQAFSRREVSVALLDSRAGSPPNAAELFRRHAFEGGQEALTELLAEWERWAAEILESHVSYPILCYYRSQHDTQSWLSALVSILDTCSLLISVIEGPSLASGATDLCDGAACGHRPGVRSSMSRSEGVASGRQGVDRLPSKDFYRLCEALGDNHLQLCGDPAAAKRLNTIRALYEPHALALSDYLRMPLPVWVAPPKVNDQWSVLTKLRTDAELALKVRDDSAVSFHDD